MGYSRSVAATLSAAVCGALVLICEGCQARPFPAADEATAPGAPVTAWCARAKCVDGAEVRKTLWLAAPVLTDAEDGVIDVEGDFLVVVYHLEWKRKIEKSEHTRFVISVDSGTSWTRHDMDYRQDSGGFRLSLDEAPAGIVVIAVVPPVPREEPRWPGDFKIRFRR